MKFIAKRFVPADNLNKNRAIFIVGEAKDGLTRYVALIDLYHPEDRWVEEMSVSKVTPGADGAKPTFKGVFRHVVDETEWRAAVTCFNSHNVFDEYDYNQVEKNVVDQKLRNKLAPYAEWVWDRKDGIDSIPPRVAQQIERFKQRYLKQLHDEEQKEKEHE